MRQQFSGIEYRQLVTVIMEKTAQDADHRWMLSYLETFTRSQLSGEEPVSNGLP